MIDLDGVTKRFEGKRQVIALDAVSLSISSGVVDEVNRQIKS